MLDRIETKYLHFEVFRCLLDSIAGEFGARMTSMDAASKNAGEMIEFARACFYTKHYAAAAGFYRRAFEAGHKDIMTTFFIGNRYQAALAAARAAWRLGEDAAETDTAAARHHFPGVPVDAGTGRLGAT